MIVFGVIAGMTAFGTLNSWTVLIASKFTVVIILSSIMGFLASVFGGLCTSSLVGVSRLRHVFVAGIWAFLGLLLFFVPLSLIILWAYARWSTAFDLVDNPGAFDSARPYLLATGVGILLAPFLIGFGYLLGGLIDRVITGAIRSMVPRERWIYHTKDGKSFPVWGPWRNPVLAGCWNVCGWGLLLTCWVPLLVSGSPIHCLAAFGLGQVCRRLARKHSATSAKSALENDRRPPIVYLRSFQDDGLFQPGIFFLVNDWLRTLGQQTVEETLSRMLAPFGPVVAIGRPDEEIAEVGAARIYVEDAHWQDLIKDLLADRDALAVLQAGVTEGLKWELETTRAHLDPEQAILFLPFSLNWSWGGKRKVEFNKFCKWAEHYFPGGMPDDLQAREFFFYFNSQQPWKARPLGLSSRIPPTHPLRKMLAEMKVGRGLRPWTLVNVKRFLMLGLIAILSTCIIQGFKYLFLGNADDKRATQTVATATATPDPVGGRKPEASRAVPVGGMEHTGKVFPYRLVLGPGWRRIPDDTAAVDVHLKYGEHIEFVVIAGKEEEDLDGFLAKLSAGFLAKKDAAGMKVWKSSVVKRERKIMLQGNEWYDGEIETLPTDGGAPIYSIARGMTRKRGTLLIIATLHNGDPETRRALEAAFDGFEIPPVD